MIISVNYEIIDKEVTGIYMILESEIMEDPRQKGEQAYALSNGLE